MSFESYAHHIAQKHRLAIALAVLKDKPESISIDNYLEDLRNKINDGNSDDEMVCSDDFNLDDDDNNTLSVNDYESNTQHSLNILKIVNNDKVNNNDKTFINESQESTSILNNEVVNDLESNNDVSSNRNNEMIQKNIVIKESTSNNTNINRSIAVMKDFPNGNHYRNFDEKIISNNIEKAMHHTQESIQPYTQDIDSTYYDSQMFENAQNIYQQNIITSNRNNSIINDKPIANTTNTNESISILKDIVVNENINFNESRAGNNNDETIKHIQESIQADTEDVEGTYYHTKMCGNDRNINGRSSNNTIVNDNQITNNKNTNESVSLLKNFNDEENLDFDGFRINVNNNRIELQPQLITAAETQDLNSTYCDTRMYENAQNFSNITEILRKEKSVLTDNNLASQTTETQNFTHVSQSQYENIKINENLFKNVNSIKPNANTVVNEESSSIKQTINRDKTNNFNTMEVDIQENYYKPNIISQEIGQSLKTPQINENNDRINENNDVTNETIEDNETEVIPFKVIEELNKVKSYLNKNAERRMSVDGSLDSGYKSDSQSRSSFKNSSQSSVSFLNQSGHCLFDFIVNAPVLINAQEIINEIAQVLAQLIDRLHLEEKYLVFLDELLEKIDFLLHEILTSSCDENLLLKKDEDTQRLLLLNISPNIQKYTINKIIIILENIQTKLSNTEELYEIFFTEESENLCHIFHILEVLLKKYVKKKDVLTPKTSQTDLKKSSITDIWRRKWNPNFKNSNNENVNSNLSHKTCVLSKCCEVLNKLVVSCMDGYSLISFAALQCFNVIQM